MKRIAIVVAAFALTLQGTTAAYARIPDADRAAAAAAIAAETPATHAQPAVPHQASVALAQDQRLPVSPIASAPVTVTHPAPSAQPFTVSTPIALALAALLMGLAGIAATLVVRNRHARQARAAI
jgi:hypothetical protein